MAPSAAREVQAYQQAGGALGPHLADQWMLPLALAVVQAKQAAVYTCTEITEHASTNAQVIEAFLPVRFDVTEVGPDLWRVALGART